MKKHILKIIILIGIFFNSNILAVTNEEVNAIKNFIDLAHNSKLKIPSLNFKTKNFDITTDFIKYDFKDSYQDEDNHYIDAHFSMYGYIIIGDRKIKLYSGGSNSQEYHNLTQIVCDKKDYLNLILLEENFMHYLRAFHISYSTSIYEISKNNGKFDIKYTNNETNNIFDSPFDSIELDSQNSKERYPYYNKEKIINRLVETGFCKKDEIVEGKIVKLESVKVLSLEGLINKVKNKGIKIDTYYLVNSFVEYPFTNKTVQIYNDIAYYLQQTNANDEAIFILEEIVMKFPNRSVASLNLADAYIGIGNKETAKYYYQRYIELMKQDNKEEKIPKRVLEFLKK